MKKEIREVYSFRAMPSIIKQLDKNLKDKRYNEMKRSEFIEALIVVANEEFDKNKKV